MVLFCVEMGKKIRSFREKDMFRFAVSVGMAHGSNLILFDFIPKKRIE
jgi:hypothetical protein